MLGICNSDTRMNLVYQQLKQKCDCVLLDDFTPLGLKFDAIVLPMSGLKDDESMIMRSVEMKCSSDFFGMLKEDGVLVCGTMTKKLKELPYKKINLNDLDYFIAANSKLTAEGVLFLLLDHTKKGLLEIQVDLLGYGNSGKAIYDLLKRLGVDVRVVRRVVEEEKEDFISIEEYRGCKPREVIINTSVTNYIDDIMIKKMDENLIINLVKLANINEMLLRQRFCQIVHAGPLPALFSPVSAASILSDTLMEVLYGD